MTDPSLLFYLGDSSTPFRLVLSDEPGGVHAGNPPRFPFQIINDKAPLTRIVRACVKSDAGSSVRTVALMLSRDDYPLLEDAAVLATNDDIDSIWQQACQGFKEAGTLIDLNAQGFKQTLSTFRSLFYCTKTEVFFHPPCPKCGQMLELCRDDAILEASGLKSYSASLKRYLACPVCLHSGESRVFYSRMPDDADPACVKGQGELIAGLLQLGAGDFPCIRCPERPSCSSEGAAHTRIVPFAFYPFYLLMFEAPTLNAGDYLALVSGAEPAELEDLLAKEKQFGRSRSVGLLKDRAGQLALFAGDERRFLEVLFLKLSLLGEIAQHTLSDGGMGSSLRFGPSLESLWIKMPEQSSLLPALWSFRLAVMDMGLDIPGMLPLQDEGYAYRILGVLWLQALLKNRTQDLRAVNEHIRLILCEKVLDRSEAAFQACNVFWDPVPAPQQWSDFWDRTLDLGRDLLVGMNSPDEFWNAFHELRDAIRKELFTGAPGVAEAGEPCRQENRDDEQIGLMLRRIRSRMGQAAKDTPQEKTLIPERTSGGKIQTDFEATVVITSAEQAMPQEVHEEYESTVILSGSGDREKIVEEPEEDFRTETVLMQGTGISPPGDASVILTTDASVILTREAGKGSRPATGLDETVVMGGKPAKDLEETAIRVGKPEADTEKTMIMDSRPAVDLEETIVLGGGPAGEKPVRKGQESKAGQDDPEATVIMGAAAEKVQASPQEASASEASDGLEETVIMPPKKK